MRKSKKFRRNNEIIYKVAESKANDYVDKQKKIKSSVCVY